MIFQNGVTMSRLTISSFAKCLKDALQPPNTNEAVIILLFGWVVSKESVKDKNGNAVVITSKLVSDLFKQKVNVHKAIKDYLSTQSSVEEAIAHMDEMVIPMINPVMLNDLIGKLALMVDADESIPEEKKEELKSLKAVSSVKFLANTFLYAVAKPNIDEQRAATVEEVVLARETSGLCPKCGKPFFKRVKGKMVSNYEIVDLSGKDETPGIFNSIMLCSACADFYLAAPSEHERDELIELKNAVDQTQKAIQAVSEISLLEDIAEIVQALVDIEGSLEELSLDALRIDKKFRPENAMAQNEIRAYALAYYRYIESLFSDASRFKSDVHEMIASQVKSAWLELDRVGLSQPEIVEQLTEWVRMRAEAPRSQANACKAVVAYFIQDCEVFREVSK